MSFITMSIGFFFAIGLFAFGQVQKKFRGISLFAAASASFGAGLLFLGLRDYLPNFFTVIIANTLITAGLVFYLEGTRQFIGKKGAIRPLSILAIVANVGLFYYFTYPAPSINNRIIVISGIAVILSTACAIELFRDRSKHWGLSGIMTGVNFLGYGGFQLYRIVYTLNETKLLSFMDAGNVHAFAFLAIIILVSGTSFGYIWMVSKSLEFELTELANHDQLTKILNRRGVESFAQQEFSKASRIDSDLAVIMTDIDDFKKVNDSFGHQVGDEILASFADLIGNNLRPYDILGRLGGEEFIIVLPNTTVEQAQLLAERLRKKVEEFSFQVNKKEIGITASFGIAKQLPEMDTLEKTIPFADKALYRSKQQGRNKVTVYS